MLRSQVRRTRVATILAGAGVAAYAAANVLWVMWLVNSASVPTWTLAAVPISGVGCAWTIVRWRRDVDGLVEMRQQTVLAGVVSVFDPVSGTGDSGEEVDH